MRILKKEIFNDETQHVCPKCNKHYPLTPKKRFELIEQRQGKEVAQKVTTAIEDGIEPLRLLP